MEIKKPAMAGTLESSDCQVTVEPGNGSVEFNLESAVINQYGNFNLDMGRSPGFGSTRAD